MPYIIKPKEIFWFKTKFLMQILGNLKNKERLLGVILVSYVAIHKFAFNGLSVYYSLVEIYYIRTSKCWKQMKELIKPSTLEDIISYSIWMNIAKKKVFAI